MNGRETAAFSAPLVRGPMNLFRYDSPLIMYLAFVLQRKSVWTKPWSHALFSVCPYLGLKLGLSRRPQILHRGSHLWLTKVKMKISARHRCLWSGIESKKQNLNSDKSENMRELFNDSSSTMFGNESNLSLFLPLFLCLWCRAKIRSKTLSWRLI